MLRTHSLFSAPQGSLVEPLALGVTALRVEEVCEVVEGGGKTRVLLAEAFRLLQGSSQEQLLGIGGSAILIGPVSGLHVLFPGRRPTGRKRDEHAAYKNR